MSIWRLQNVLRTADNIPENFLSNTLYVDIDFSSANVDLVDARVQTFFNSLRTLLIGELLAETGHMTKWYAVPGAPPNYPQVETEWDFTAAPTGDCLPSEVALCLSFQAQRVAGLEQSRRRGRIYIGPLKTTTNVDGRPSQAVRDNLATAGATLGAGINSDTGGDWVVYSAANGGAVPVANGWVDDSFDTQRRRGVSPTARSTFTV